MQQQHEDELATEQKQSATKEKRTRQESAETIAAEQEAHKVELANEKAELEASKNTEQRNALVAQKQILKGQHNKETAANKKEHEAQLAAKDKQCESRNANKDTEHEGQLVAVEKSFRQQANKHMVPKHKVEALMEYVKTFPQGFETITTDGTKLLCGLDAVVKTMEAMHPSLPRPTVPELQALLKSDAWQKQIEDFSVTDYNPEKFSAYEIDMNNHNDFRVDQLASLLALWAHTEGRNMNLRIGCFVNGHGPELLFHGNDDGAVVVWIQNDAANLGFLDMSKGHYMGMKPFDHVGRAAAEKQSAAQTERLLKQQSKDRETIAQLKQQCEHVVLEENLGGKIADLETANTTLGRKAEQLTTTVVGLETDKASLESKVGQLTNNIAELETNKASLGRQVEKFVGEMSNSETDKAGLEIKVEKLKEGALSTENTKLKALYKASVTTTVEQGKLIAEFRGRSICQCGGVQPAKVKGPQPTPGRPAKKAVRKDQQANPFIFGAPAANTDATKNGSSSGERAPKPINKAKKPSKKAKGSSSDISGPPLEHANYVERTNIFDTGDSAVEAGDKARAGGVAKKAPQETKKPNPFTFGASAIETGETSENPGFQFTVPVVMPAGCAERTIPFRFKEPVGTAREQSGVFGFGVSAGKAAEEPTPSDHVDSEQPAKKSRVMPQGSAPESRAPDAKVPDNAEGPRLSDHGDCTDKAGEKEEKPLNDGKRTSPLVGKSTEATVSSTNSIL